jgi:hypothetical protein
MIRRYAVLMLLSGMPVMAEAQTAGSKQRATDRDLIAAGFVMRPADTPGKLARLKAIPAYRFSARTKNGVRYYIYADPSDCKCAFVGYQKAYDSYRDMIKPPAPPPGIGEFSGEARSGNLADHLMVNEMDEDAGLMGGDDIFHLNF